ncbi:MAG: serine hydrolase domain-containing protein [Bacteroidia bacterium]|nr:serine hydrolase domain-containing protein [Bacteroidia bacterium]
MSKTLLIFAAIFILGGKSYTQIPSLDIENYVQQYLNLDIFSGVVLVAEKGIPVYQKAFGLSDREKNIPNTLHTQFIIGSMNKSYTRVVILQLIEEGKLTWDDKMIQHLDGFTLVGTDQITIRHLLNHTSGYGDYHSRAFFELPFEQKNIATITKIAQRMELLFPPGDGNEYSNTGYVLLGAIIEKVTGKSYAENVKTRIIMPLGLKNTYVENVKTIPERSIGYLKTLEGVEDNLHFLMEPKPDGGFWATAEDVMIFYRNFFYGDKLISPASRENDDFFQQIQPVYEMPGRAIPIAGGSNGNNTVHIEMLQNQTSIVVLANMDEPVAEKVGLGILKIINGNTPETPTLPAILTVHKAYMEKGVEYVKENFETLTRNFHPSDPKDIILNNLGYYFLHKGKTADALAIFRLNTEQFPEVANCWDSYGEALVKAGDKAAALAAYRKALDIRPDLRSAQDAIKALNE